MKKLILLFTINMITCSIFLLITNSSLYANDTSNCNLKGDYNNDCKIDIKEVICVMQAIAGLNNPSIVQGQVIFGGLTDAKVNISLPTASESSIYTAYINETGTFSANLSRLNPDDYIVISVSEGKFAKTIDGHTANPPISYTGTIHSLIQVSDIYSGNCTISVLSDIVYQYAKNLMTDVDAKGLKIRLNDIARVLFQPDVDLNNDNVLDANDLIAFDPLNVTHNNMLSFDYQEFLTNETNGYSSVLTCYYQNRQDELFNQLNRQFGTQLSLYPDKDSRSSSVKINVVAFGRGKVNSNSGTILIDSEANEQNNVYFDFFEISDSQKITLTAQPIESTTILGWDGCDRISSDKTQCICNLDRDHEIRVSFGYEETIVKPNFVDVSRAKAVKAENMLTITVSYGDTELLDQMNAITPNTYVIGSTDGGFLRKVLSIEKISNRTFLLITNEDASLEDIVKQGTGNFSRIMTHGDLSPDTSQKRIQGIKGVRLLSSDNPNETRFTIQLGQKSKTRDSEHWEETVVLYDDNGVKVELAGEINLEIQVNTQVSFGLLSGLEGFKFETVVQADEQIEFIASGEVEGDWETKLPGIKFGGLTFFIGPVPVYLSFNLDLSVGAGASLSASLTTGIQFDQNITAGINYTKDSGFQAIKEFNKSWQFNPPELNAHASVNACLKPAVNVMLYDLTGPKVSAEPGLKITAKPLLSDEVINYCRGGIDFTSWFTFESHFSWDFSGDTKIGKLLKLDELEEMTSFPIVENEFPISNWNVGGECDLKPAKLNLTGNHVYHVQPQGSGEVIQRQYTIQNSGSFELDWEIEYTDDPFISISQTQGKLGENQNTIVTMSIDTQDLPIGIYHRWIKFTNKSNQSLFLPDILTGSTYRIVNIAVMPPELKAPVMSEASLHSPTIVKLNWEYPHTDSREYVKGYYVFRSTDQKNWKIVSIIPHPGQTNQLISDLDQNTEYYFSIAAYDQLQAQSDPSNTIMIKTGIVPVNEQFTNSLGMTFVYIPPGTFMMGSPTDELGRGGNETQHQVTLTKGYFMQTTEVTQGQWKAVMGSNPSYFQNCGDNCPVEEVYWYKVQDFIESLNQKEGTSKYRLPTEAEWEYAARAGSSTAFANGAITERYCDYDPNLDAMGWYCGNSNDKTHPVAQKLSNAWGLYDMHGNVWEWCQDWYNSYPENSVTDPTGPSLGSYRVLRGGSWGDSAHYCRSAKRDSDSPGDRLSYCGGFLGLRLSRTP
ncbi:secreted protein containing Sulphatase-modifying factor domain protein [Candidatus Magnetomorum sp. HK-1]|nr:secreted protein containing Sulphatase-modifying factor domain protein [Candidatus Magnetomorum sp. HK-1]